MTARVRRTKLGSQGFDVSAQGLGCMSMSWSYGAPKPEADMIKVIHHAIRNGVTHLDTADIYGPNEDLIGKALKGLPREKVQVATKFGNRSVNGRYEICGHPDYVREACEASLKRLGVSYIDLYYIHRIDTKIPIEITIGAMKKLVEERKIKYIGLSEASPDTIRRAHAVHPITAVQLEWSLWTRDSEEEVIPLCRQLGIGIVAFSPLGKGFFASGGKIVEKMESTDFRRTVPKFQPENIQQNNQLYDRVAAIAVRKGCTTAQLALAWVHHQGKDVCPIPGTTKIENLESNINALSVKLTQQDITELEAIAAPNVVKGDRYSPAFMATTWRFANTPQLSTWKPSDAAMGSSGSSSTILSFFSKFNPITLWAKGKAWIGGFFVKPKRG